MHADRPLEFVDALDYAMTPPPLPFYTTGPFATAVDNGIPAVLLGQQSAQQAVNGMVAAANHALSGRARPPSPGRPGRGPRGGGSLPGAAAAARAAGRDALGRDEVASELGAYVAAGASHFLLWFLDAPERDGMALFAERVLPALRGATVSGG